MIVFVVLVVAAYDSLPFDLVLSYDDLFIFKSDEFITKDVNIIQLVIFLVEKFWIVPWFKCDHSCLTFNENYLTFWWIWKDYLSYRSSRIMRFYWIDVHSAVGFKSYNVFEKIWFTTGVENDRRVFLLICSISLWQKFNGMAILDTPSVCSEFKIIVGSFYLCLQ